MSKIVQGTLLILIPVLAFGTDYHVAMDGDNTAGDGTIGNPYATIQKALNKADTPGDNILVRGGTYGPQASVYFGGDETGLITIKPYPGEKVVFDGSVPITGWTKCTGPDDCGGNPDWAEIYYAETPSGIPLFNANVYEGDTIMQMGQRPYPSDTYYDRTPSEFRSVSGIDSFSATALSDPAFITETEEDYWKGATMLIHSSDNRMLMYTITTYDASTHTITYSSVPGINRSQDSYALANHPGLLDRAGTYCYRDTEKRLYARPFNTASLESGAIRMTKLSRAFYISSVPYICIEGFTFKHYANNVVYIRMNSDHCILRNCTFINGLSSSGATILCHSSHHCLIENNRMIRNKYNKAIILQDGGNNTVAGNYLDYNGSTNIDFYTEANSACVNNTVLRFRGVHANGLTFYVGCSNTLIAGNYVADGNIPLTMQASSGFTICNNIFKVASGYAIANWGGGSDKTKVLNNTIIGNIYLPGAGVIMKNNIMKSHCAGSNDEQSHNIHYSSNGCNLQEGESVITGLSQFFVDYNGKDYLPPASSPAVDAGTDVTALLPVDDFPYYDFFSDRRGAARPTGGGWDIGAYEYTTSKISNDKLQITNALLPVPNPARWTQVMKIPGVRVLNLDGSDAVSGQQGIYLLRQGNEIKRVMIVE